MIGEMKYFSFFIEIPWWLNLSVLVLAVALVFGTMWLMKRHKKGKKPS